MCVLCIEINKKLMTKREVARAFREFAVPKDHLGDIMVEIENNYGLDEVGEELQKIYEEELDSGS